MTPFEQLPVGLPLGHGVDAVVVIGRPTLSHPVQALLVYPGVRVVVVDAHAPWVDISGNASVVVADLEPVRELIHVVQVEWALCVCEAARDIDEHIGSLLTSGPGRAMLNLARGVAASTNDPLVLSVSNPMRAFDLAAPTLGGCIAHSNRGQAGIDGTVATAVGVCMGSRCVGEASAPTDKCVTATMGDLTACHDASSLVLAASIDAYLDITVADNQGGGTLAALEYGHATSAETYDRQFGLAQLVDYEALTAAYGMAFVRADVPRELEPLSAYLANGPHLIHVPVERAAHLHPAVRDVPSQRNTCSL